MCTGRLSSGESVDAGFTIATNASLVDGRTLLQTVPHWVRVFGERIAEIVVIVDDQPLSGRIAELHAGAMDAPGLAPSLDELQGRFSFLRSVPLSSLNAVEIQRKWFGAARPVRCQAGTPILAFVAAVEAASTEFVLRCDSDMLFHERGWLAEAESALMAGVHFYEPPRARLQRRDAASSRAFMVYKPGLAGTLPLRHLKLDLPRRIHRFLRGRPSWIALEQMIQKCAARGEMRHLLSTTGGIGFSLHGLRREFFSKPWLPEVVASVEAGMLPQDQRQLWDLNPNLWHFNAGVQPSCRKASGAATTGSRAGA